MTKVDAFLAALAIVLLPSSASAQTKLRVAYPTTVGSMGILWVTKDAGLFEKYGLDVSLIYISGSSKIVRGAEARHAELLAFEVFGSFDDRLDHELLPGLVIRACEHDQIGARLIRLDHGGNRDLRDGDFLREHRLDDFGAAGDIDEAYVEAVFLE